MGNNVDLLEHMRSNNIGRLRPKTVLKWLKDHDSFLDAFRQQGLGLEDLSVDHILPSSIGGINHPYNYYILPKSLNNQWSGWWTQEKLTCMGEGNATTFKAFLLWLKEEGDRLGIDYNAFDHNRYTSTYVHWCSPACLVSKCQMYVWYIWLHLHMHTDA